MSPTRPASDTPHGEPLRQHRPPRPSWADLYIDAYAAGHARGCPQAIPEARAMAFAPACACGEVRP